MSKAPEARERLDTALVRAGLFESRAKAQDAIAAGLVQVDGLRATKPGERVRAEAQLDATPAFPWASRSGLKLAAALDCFAIDPAGQVCLDVGASTGGFTDVLLARGAAHVFAVDVGRDQLHPRLCGDRRVTDLSGTDARALTPAMLRNERPTLVVSDASFISLRLVLPAALALAAPAARLVALVKPQFEVGPGRTDRGIVRDAALRQAVCNDIVAWLDTLGWHVQKRMPSPITGRDGNVEFLLTAVRV